MGRGGSSNESSSWEQDEAILYQAELFRIRSEQRMAFQVHLHGPFDHSSTPSQGVKNPNGAPLKAGLRCADHRLAISKWTWKKQPFAPLLDSTASREVLPCGQAAQAQIDVTRTACRRRCSVIPAPFVERNAFSSAFCAMRPRPGSRG